MRWGAILAAAGRGTRFGRPKQLIDVAGAPMAAWSIDLFAAMPEIVALVIVCEAEHRELFLDLGRAIAGAKLLDVVAGGASRQASVGAGLHAIAPACDAIAVHDGARPLVIEHDVRTAMALVQPGHAAVLATPVVDTIKEVGARDRRVVRTLDRSRLWAAQTPQLAMSDDLQRAHDAARQSGSESTDDVALLEAIGVQVVVVPSTAENFKVTYPHDLERARAILAQRRPPLMREAGRSH